MCKLNRAGQVFGQLDAVQAMTDVTGFGLLGHLLEMAEGSRLTARLDASAVPVIDGVMRYLEDGCIPGGTLRNFASYGHKVSPLAERWQHLLCDPQTSGGLLVAVAAGDEDRFLAVAKQQGLTLSCIGELLPPDPSCRVIVDNAKR